MSQHVLNRPIWNALSTLQSKFALGSERARRFAQNIGPLASAKDDTTESLSDLAQLVASYGSLILLQADSIVIPGGVETIKTASGVQMVLESPVQPTKELSDKVRLTEVDATAMVELAKLTQPGPFELGTPSLGEFWGIKSNGKLLAMAGERMKHTGYTEISGVCVHPDARGRGYARYLSSIVAENIQARGEIPYLHAYATNNGAIRLYESLGFRLRCAVHVAVLG